jgi:hypothetical protein
MKRVFLIPLMVLLLATMACSLTGTKPTEAPVEPTKAVVAPATATEPPAQPEAKPTNTEVSPTEAPAAEATATEAPATEAPPESKEIKETFDRPTSNWSAPMVVTSQASGRDPRMTVTVDAGFMRFAISDKETYAYSFYNEELADATTIEADFQLKGALNTGIALVCMANGDRTNWFEMRVSAGDSFYKLYRYDKQLKEVQNKNPYVLLGKGVLKKGQYFPTMPNHVVFTCSDSELTVDFNNGKLTGKAPVDMALDGTTWGVGVMSADVLPGTVDFDTVVIR